MAATIDDLDVVDLSDLDNGGEDNQQNGGEQTTPRVGQVNQTQIMVAKVQMMGTLLQMS